MRVFVQRVTEINEATVIPVPTFVAPDKVVGGPANARLEVEVIAVVSGDAANWKVSVGHYLEVQGFAPDGWWDRCDAYYVNSPGEPERCAFPSLRCPAWTLHPTEHESLRFCWGAKEVEEIKEMRRTNG